jgi:hypothetical protein
VDPVRAMADSLPEEAAQIRRKFWRDPAFRAVCEDHRDALEAMARLAGTAAPSAADRIEEYRLLVQELVAEAKAMLASEGPRA